MGPLVGAVKVLLLAQAMHGTIVGRVWDTDSVRPIAGAVVTLAGLNQVTATDDEGRYVFRDVPTGDHQITVRFIGYAPRSLQALVPQQGQLEIDIWLLPEPVPIHAMDVHASVVVRGLDTKRGAFPDREISAAAIRNHPMLSELDAFEALGGGEVFLRPESPSGVNIRGGASDQTAYLLDGIPIFNPYHAAGVSSGLNPDALARVRLSSAVPLEESPTTLSGSIESTTRTPEDRTRGQGSVSTTQSRVTFDGPLGPAGMRFLVSQRSGLPGALSPGEESSYLRGETGDWLGKLEARALGGGIQLLGYWNENDVNTAVVAAPEDWSVPDPRRNVFEWNSRSLGAQWRRVFSNTTVRVLGWRADGDLGSTWAARSGPLNMAAVRRDKGLLVSAERNSSRAGTVAQLRIERSLTSYEIVSDSTSGPTWGMEANAPIVTALARHRHAIGKKLEVNLGSTLAAARNKGYLGPSTQLVWSPSDRLEVSGSYARTHQFAQSLRNAESVVGNVFPADLYIGAGAGAPAGAPAGVSDIPVAHSHLGVLALGFRPRPGLRLGVQGYARRSHGLLLVAPREGNPFATTADAFGVGAGLSRGVSAEASLSARRYGVVVSYGFQEVRLDHGDAAYTPENGATHLFEGGVIGFPSTTTSVRLGLTAALGRRATAIAGGFEWESNNLLDKGSEFGGSPYYDGQALGATSLPAYYRLDVRVRKEWRVGFQGRDVTVALFGTATNLMGRRNVLTYAGDPSTGERTEVEMRPLAPLVVGLDWGF